MTAPRFAAASRASRSELARPTASSRHSRTLFWPTRSESDLVGQNKARECRDEAIQRAGAEREALLAAANRGAVIAITASR